MLDRYSVTCTLPASDMERAKRFYDEKLGLTPAAEDPDGYVYDVGEGTRFTLFPSAGTPSGTHTQIAWRVDDVAKVVEELRSKGVEFEKLDMPGFDPSTMIAQLGDGRGAWFKDSEGNLHGIVQLPEDSPL